jgi:transposase-like protein
MLSKNQDKKAAKRFLKKSMVGNEIPFMITTDKSGSNLSALHRYNVRNKEKQIYIRDVKYKNNRIE